MVLQSSVGQKSHGENLGNQVVTVCDIARFVSQFQVSTFFKVVTLNLQLCNFFHLESRKSLPGEQQSCCCWLEAESFQRQFQAPFFQQQQYGMRLQFSGSYNYGYFAFLAPEREVVLEGREMMEPTNQLLPSIVVAAHEVNLASLSVKSTIGLSK